MIAVIGLIGFIAVTWFFAWVYGQHLVEKGYLASWKAIRSDWFLILVLVLAGSCAANGFWMILGWILKGAALLLGV